MKKVRTSVFLLAHSDCPLDTKKPKTVLTLPSNYGNAYLFDLCEHKIKTGIIRKTSLPWKFKRSQFAWADIGKLS